MSSIETLVSEVARATGLGQNSQKFIGVVAEYIFKQPGGLSGFKDKFLNAGLGDIVTSWMSGSPSMRTIEPGQIRAALGSQDIEEIGQKAGIGGKLVPSLLAIVAPLLIRSFTSGGTVPNALPAAFAGLSGTTGKKKQPFRLWRWLIPLLALLALAWCGWQSRSVVKAPTAAPPAANIAAVPAAPTLAFQNTGGKVSLNGTLSTIAEKSDLIGKVAGVFGMDNVKADIKVDAAAPPASWLKGLAGLLPQLKYPDLKFAFHGDSVELDTSALPPEKRAEVSRLFQQQLGNVEVKGLFDEGTKALANLKPGYDGTQLTQALNATTLNFETGSARLTTSNQAIIEQAAKAIQGAPAGLQVEVGGHTDNKGNASLNQALSEQRAKAVVAALVAEGVPAERLTARGFGSNQPLKDNDTEAGRAANRRIAYTTR